MGEICKPPTSMTKDPTQTINVLAWAQPYLDRDQDEASSIPFDLNNRHHIDAILLKIWAARCISSYPPSFQAQVTKLSDTVSMLYHEIMGHSNAPSVITEEHVMEKQRDFLAALQELLCDSTNQKGKNRIWVIKNVVEVLLQPPPPPPSWIQLYTSVLSKTASFFISAPGTSATVKGRTSRDADEACGTTTQNSAAERSLRRRTVAEDD